VDSFVGAFPRTATALRCAAARMHPSANPSNISTDRNSAGPGTSLRRPRRASTPPLQGAALRAAPARPPGKARPRQSQAPSSPRPAHPSPASAHAFDVDPQRSQHKQQTNQQELAPRPSSPAPSLNMPAGDRQRSCAALAHLTAPTSHFLAMRVPQLSAVRRRGRQPSPGHIEAGRAAAIRGRMQRA